AQVDITGQNVSAVPMPGTLIFPTVTVRLAVAQAGDLPSRHRLLSHGAFGRCRWRIVMLSGSIYHECWTTLIAPNLADAWIGHEHVACTERPTSIFASWQNVEMVGFSPHQQFATPTLRRGGRGLGLANTN